MRGCPWEIGLVETQQALVANGLRHKIRLQVDGGLKTGIDIIKAAILGAESFGFGTGPMVALGCKYLRICHLNNCATGRGDFRMTNCVRITITACRFKVTNYFEFIAREVRELMAQLGVKRLVDLIGRTDLLKELEGFTAPSDTKLELSRLLETAEPPPGKALHCAENNPPFDNRVLNAQLLRQSETVCRRAPEQNLLVRYPQHRPFCWRVAVGLYRATHGDQGLASEPNQSALQRYRRPELRRVERGRRGVVSDR